MLSREFSADRPKRKRLNHLSEQKRIAAILEKADRQRRLRRYALELSDTFLPSVFLDMLGDPATNPKGWKKHSKDTVTARGKRPRRLP